MSNFWSLKPHLVSKVWGGEKLKEMKGLKTGGDPLGESWEVSRLTDGSCKVLQGSDEVNLGDLVSEEKLPYLVKFIDTTDNLSVQVHPGDEFARKYESSKGKTECWLILASEQGAGIYLGLLPGIKEEDLEKAIEEGQELSKLMNFYPVQRGDFFFVPAGSIHAIGSGVTLVEIQQSSGVTYRVWDWNRVGLDGEARELHVEKAMKVIEFRADANTKEFFQSKKELLNSKGRIELVRHSDFSVDLYNLNADEKVEVQLQGQLRLNSIINISDLNLKLDDVLIPRYQSIILNSAKEGLSFNCSQQEPKDSKCVSFLHVY